MAKIAASQLRKGNMVEKDGDLFIVLNAESIHPGKGTPVTQLDMRNIRTGVKVADRYKTTDVVERAYVEDRDFQYLYQDGTDYVFMNSETFDQVHISGDTVGDVAVYLQENMTCKVQLFEDNPVAIELPQRVTLEIVETEPTVKGQTASSSYKPAILSNGVRVMVPPHIATGTRIVILTAEGTYVERARD